MAKRISYSAMLTALAMIMSYIESVIPYPGNIMGIKLGLANIVCLSALYILNEKYAVLINLLRVLLTGILFGNVYSLAFSLAGAVLSLIVMIICKKIKLFSIIGISVCGAVSHNIGQTLVAVLLLGRGMVYYLPVLLISGIISGIAVGVIAGIVIKRMKKFTLW